MESSHAVTQSRTAHKATLLRVLGIGFGLAITIGGVIGVGIIRAPGQVAAQLPNPWLFISVWIVGGFYTLLCAPSIAELGTMIQRSGGLYVLVHRALGNYAGFIVGWSDWLAFCGGLAAGLMIIGDLAGRLVLPLAQRPFIVASSILVAFAFLQWLGIRWGSRTQQFTSLLKALAFIGLAVAAFVFTSSASESNAAVQRVPSGLRLVSAFVLALQGIIFTYDGYYSVVYFSEELRDPAREIPRSMFSGILLVIGIYLLINLAFLHALPLSEMAGDEFVGGSLAQAIFGARGDTMITVLIIMSTLGGINFGLLGASRILFTMSRDGLFLERAVRVNDDGTPTVALAMTVIASMIFLLTGTFEKVLAVMTFLIVGNYTLTFLSVFVLRWREPLTKRPYRAWGYPWTTALALTGATAFLMGAIFSDARNSTYAILCLAASYPVFLLTSWLAQRPPA